jgi:predicted CopG family antitoxin
MQTNTLSVPKPVKTVRVSDELHKELVKLGTYSESMDGIIRKCVKAYKDSLSSAKK